jgi:hypothetical protein
METIYLRARLVKRFWKIDLYLGWRNPARASRFLEGRIPHEIALAINGGSVN